MPGLGGGGPRENVCRCDHESNQIKTFNCRRTNFAGTSTANDGWPGPGSQGVSIPYYEPTQIRTKLVSSFSYRTPAGFKQPSHFLLRSQVSKWALLATYDLGFLENPAPVS